MRLLKNTKWNGRTYSLEKFTGIHHTSYIKLEEVAEQFQFKLTTKHTRVLYLLEKFIIIILIRMLPLLVYKST